MNPFVLSTDRSKSNIIDFVRDQMPTAPNNQLIRRNYDFINVSEETMTNSKKNVSSRKVIPIHTK
jgi:hypothetical protein